MTMNMAAEATDAAGAAAPAVSHAAEMFHSLADPSRLAIVRRLSAGEARVTDLVSETGLAQSTVSAHIGCLRDCGLVEGRADGRQTFYAIRQPLLLSLLDAAEQLLEATGHPVHLCVVHGAEAS